MVKVFVVLFGLVLALTGVALDYSLAAKTHGGAYDFSAHVAARVAEARTLVGLAPQAEVASAQLPVAATVTPAVDRTPDVAPAVIAAAPAAAAAQGSGLANLVIGGIIAGAHAATSTDKVMALADGMRLPLPAAAASAGLAQGATEAVITPDAVTPDAVTPDAVTAASADVVAAGAPQSDDEIAQEGLSAAPSEGLPDDAAAVAALGAAQQPGDTNSDANAGAAPDASAATDTAATPPTVTADAAGSHVIKPVARLANAVCVMRAGVRDCGKGN